MPGGTVACICRQGSVAADDTASLCSRVDSCSGVHQQEQQQEQEMPGVPDASQLHWPSADHSHDVTTMLDLDSSRTTQPLPTEGNAKTLDHRQDCLQLIERHLAAANNVINVATDDEDVTSSYPSLKSPLRFLTNLFNFKRLPFKDSLSLGPDLEPDSSGRKVSNGNTKPRSPNPQRFYKTLETMKSLEKLYMSRTDDPELQSFNNATSGLDITTTDADGDGLNHLRRSTVIADATHDASSSATETADTGAGAGTNGGRITASSESPPPPPPAVVLPDSNHLIRSPPPVHKGTLTYLHVQGHAGQGQGFASASGSPRKVQGHSSQKASPSKVNTCRNTAVVTEAIST